MDTRHQIEIALGHSRGTTAIERIKSAVRAGRTALHGAQPSTDVELLPVYTELRTDEPSREQGRDFYDIAPGWVPLRSVGRKYAVVGVDLAYEHGGFFKVELRGAMTLKIGDSSSSVAGRYGDDARFRS